MIFLVFIGGVIFLILPFLPTIIEVRKMTDAQPLKISSHILKDPRSSPELLFWHFTQLMGLEGLESLKNKITISEPLVVSESVLAIPSGKVPTLAKNIARVISAGSLELTPKTNYPSKILSLKSITTAADNALNEVHALEKLTLGRGNKVVWWASGNEVVIQDNVNLPGKVQGKSKIEIEGSIRFHLLEAPVISIRNSSPPSHPLVQPCDDFSKPRSTQETFLRIPGDYAIKENETVHATLIVKGTLTLGKNSKIFGNIKAHQKITLASGAQVLGNIVGVKDIELQGNNFVGGSILSQENLSVAAGSQIGGLHDFAGTPHQVTCSAKNLTLHSPFVAHGLLRAWKSGAVL